MTVTVKPYTRGDEVLKLLATHHAVSIGTLQALMRPAITRRRLREVLQRLGQRGLVSRRILGAAGVGCSFYNIAEPHRSALGLPTIHNSHLIHSDLIALANDALATSLPRASIHREHAIMRDANLRRVMLYDVSAADSLPDLLVVLTPSGATRPVRVAVEIERSEKSAKRLFRKFYKYAVQTHLDGVLYLSEDEHLLQALREFYKMRVSKRALRVGHYRDNFFVSAPCPTRQNLTIQNIINAGGNSLFFAHWMRVLGDTPMDSRRDFAFTLPASPSRECEQIEQEQNRLCIQSDIERRPPEASPSLLPDPYPPTSVCRGQGVGT